MKPEWVWPPDLIVDQVQDCAQRSVKRRRFGLRPVCFTKVGGEKAREKFPTPQKPISQDIRLVVPDETVAQRVRVADDAEENDDDDRQDLWARSFTGHQHISFRPANGSS